METLRILIVEDSEVDANLIASQIRNAGLELYFERVASAEAMEAALASKTWDAVLSDYAIPGFGALGALQILQKSGRDLPFIVVSGVIGEETAVEAMKAGAHDYVMKGNLFRLVPSIEREIREAANRRARREAKERLSAFVEATDEILAIVSHDLKNPLSAVLLNANLLMRVLPQNEHTERCRELLDRIKIATDRSLSLIQRILDTTRIEAGRFEVELKEEPARRIIEESLEMLQPLATEKKISLTTETGSGFLSTVRCDHGRMLQVFSNVVGNALKFTPEYGKVTIRVLEQGQHIRFSISDTGPGIQPEDLPHIFDRYWQVKKTGTKGTGLGLYIAKGIIEAHGGRIWVESPAGQGATFHFTLPVADASETAISAA